MLGVGVDEVARNLSVVVEEEVERVVPTSLRLNPTYIQVSAGSI